MEILQAKLSDSEFQRISEFIYSEAGIKLPPAKKIMLQGRLIKRLRSLGMASFKEYISYLFSPDGSQKEVVHLLDAVSTNKTDFFRELSHFNFLTQKALHTFDFPANQRSSRKLNVWSAGCSSGEEAYTLAMVLSEFAQQRPGFDFSILASDISTKVLDTAVSGIYPEYHAEPISPLLRKKYLMRSKDRSRNLIRIIPELRAKVNFRRINLMQLANSGLKPFHVIFCRNVLIYFDRATQERLIRDFWHYLVPQGYLFLGHSETINDYGIPFTNVHPTVYQKIV